jgi:hypothetical protein
MADYGFSRGESHSYPESPFAARREETDSFSAQSAPPFAMNPVFRAGLRSPNPSDEPAFTASYDTPHRHLLHQRQQASRAYLNLVLANRFLSERSPTWHNPSQSPDGFHNSRAWSRDRFYEYPFWPKTVWTNFCPYVLDKHF